ncbi:MAG: NAD(P)/FAD-dependent oxidoreductase [Bdellovibrionota bacterium]
MKNYDVAVLGAGPGGSQAATLLARAGFKTIQIERLEFPRFRIGESLLPASMPLLKESGFYPKLASGKYIEKFGARFIDYKTDEEVYFGFSGGLNSEIPSAFEVPRAEFDADMLGHAVSVGVELWQPCTVDDVTIESDAIVLQTANGAIRAKFLIDASGRQSVVGKKLNYKKLGGDFNNLGVFAHFKGVERAPDKNEGDIRIGILRDKSWSWQIPFKGNVTSVGVVSRSKEIPKDDNLEQYLLDAVSGTPKMKDYMKSAERISDIQYVSNYAQECEKFWGARWLLVGDAAKFLDPCFSSGVHNSIQSATFAAKTIINALNTSQDLEVSKLGENYEKDFRKGIDRFHSLIELFYSDDFVPQMKKTLQRKELEKAFTSAVAGDMWDDNNVLFQRSIL